MASSVKAVAIAAGLPAEALTQLHTTARAAAECGAAVLMEHYGHLSNIRSKGRQGDLVTEADEAAEHAVLTLLQQQTPSIGILAEESGSIGPDAGLQWMVDPLDGTTNFAHGYPLFATSVGLCWNGQPLLGAIAVPYLRQLYHCCPGVGAFCNDEPIGVSRCDKLKDALLVTGFAYDRHTRLDNNYAEFCWMTHRTHGVRRGGAAAVDLAFVAAGLLDGYWERGLAPWDLAAGVALVQLAGGTVSAYDSTPFQIKSGTVLAANPSLHQELSTELAKVSPLNGDCFGAPGLGHVGS
ncbi:MAG: inositol monophosphatase family protein [Synechococcus sp.]